MGLSHGAGDGELSLDRGVVGEADGEAVLASPRAASGGQRRGGWIDVEPAGEDVVDRVPAPSARERPKRSVELVEDAAPLGPQVEVPAEDQGRRRGPLDRPARRRELSSAAASASAVLAWRLAIADAGVEAGEGERAPLGPVRRTRARAARRSRPAAAADEGQVRAALVGGDQVGVVAGEQRAQARRASCVRSGRCAPRRRSRGRGRAGPPRRALLQQGDVPVGPASRLENSSQQVAVDLEVGVVSLVESGGAASARCAAPGRAGSRGRGRGSS